MAKIYSPLFKEFVLSDKDKKTFVGGYYTTSGSDTTTSEGYDITFDTLDSSGSSQGDDTHNTGATTRDKPEVK